MSQNPYTPPAARMIVVRYGVHWRWCALAWIVAAIAAGFAWRAGRERDEAEQLATTYEFAFDCANEAAEDWFELYKSTIEDRYRSSELITKKEK